MQDRERTWLLKCAERLNPRNEFPVHVRRLLHELSIPLKKVTPGKRGKALAELHKLGPGEYRIELVRESLSPRPLSARERFTLAHELGHVLLDHRFNWRPTTEREYHRGERLCNVFAAKLLVPDSALQDLEPGGPDEGLNVLRTVTRRCRISLEVAARRLVEVFPILVYLEGTEVRTKADQDAFEIAWSAAATQELGLARHRRIRETHAVGRLLLGRTDRGGPDALPQSVEAIAIARSSRGRKLVCMKRAAEERPAIREQVI